MVGYKVVEIITNGFDYQRNGVKKLKPILG